MQRLILFIFVLCILILLFCSCNKERVYCGNVVERFTLGGGYKVQPEAHIVIYNDSLRRNVDVTTTWNTYVNAQIGDRVCFELGEYDLNH